MNQLYADTLSLIDLARSYLEDLKYDPAPTDKEGTLIQTIFFVSKLNFASSSANLFPSSSANLFAQLLFDFI